VSDERHLEGDAADELPEIGARLTRERPTPSASFRSVLGARLAALDPGYGHRPERLQAVVLAYLLAGALLILLGLLIADGVL